MADIKSIQMQSHRIAREHGFWDGPENDNIPTKVALIHSEVSEALEAYRSGDMEISNSYSGGPEGAQFRAGVGMPYAEISLDDGRTWEPAHHEYLVRLGFETKPDGFPIELADIIIRVGDLAERLGIDLDHAIAVKAEYNQRRPHMHGGKRV
jgi:hypothetical protein